MEVIEKIDIYGFLQGVAVLVVGAIIIWIGRMIKGWIQNYGENRKIRRKNLLKDLIDNELERHYYAYNRIIQLVFSTIVFFVLLWITFFFYKSSTILLLTFAASTLFSLGFVSQVISEVLLANKSYLEKKRSLAKESSTELTKSIAQVQKKSTENLRDLEEINKNLDYVHKKVKKLRKPKGKDKL